MNISPNFTWEEVTHTDTGLPNEIPDPLRPNAERLANEVLEPLRVFLGPLHVNSWFRSPAVNAALPGHAVNSFHMQGLAADVVPKGDVFSAFKMAVTQINDLPIDQIIFEHRHSDWIHVGICKAGDKPRRQAMIGHVDEAGHAVYRAYNGDEQ